MSIVIYEKESQRRLFEITEEQLEELIDALEEEDSGDHDYYVDAAVCDFLEGNVDALVIAKLREALGLPPAKGKGDGDVEAAGDDDELPEGGLSEDEGFEIEWRRE